MALEAQEGCGKASSHVYELVDIIRREEAVVQTKIQLMEGEHSSHQEGEGFGSKTSGFRIFLPDLLLGTLVLLQS